MDEIAYKAGDMVTYIRHDGSEVTGEVLTAEVMYWVAWPDSAVKNLCRDVELRPRRLAVGDTFGSDDRSADELPVGTVVLDDCDHGADAWICRGHTNDCWCGSLDTRNGCVWTERIHVQDHLHPGG